MSDPRQRQIFETDPETAARPTLLRRGLFVYAALVLIVGWAYGIWQIRLDRKLTLASSENQLMLSTTGFANHVSAMIHDGVGAAVAASNEIRSEYEQPLTPDKQIVAVLTRMLTGGDYVRTLFIATPTRYSAAHRPNGHAPDARPAFVDEMLATADPTWVGKPINIEQGDANVLVPVARRVKDIGGEVTWAGALLSFASLDAVYRTLPVENIGLALSHRAGTLLVRVPTLPEYKFAGADISGFESTRVFLRQPPGDIVRYVAPDPFSGNPRQFAVRRLDDFPLRATASRDIANTLIGWRGRMFNSLLTMSVASVAVIGLTITLFVALRRRFEAVRLSQERFQLAAAGSTDGIWDWEVKSGRVYYSPRLKQLLGFQTGDNFPSTPETFWNLIHPDDVEQARAKTRDHLERHVPYSHEYRVRTRSGEYRWFQGRAQAVWNETGEPLRMAGSIADIHERKLAEQSLRQAQDRELHSREEFAQQLLIAQEQERRRLANELHDSVGQNLSLIKNRILLVLQEEKLPESAAQHAKALSDLATETIADVRTVAHNLRPLHIEDLGFTDALHTLLAKVGESTSLTVEKRIENVDDAVHGAAATHLYRIAQEALNNVIKHSRARRCSIVLERDLHCVRLCVSDDGVGIDPASASDAHGLGMASMQERARILNARWEISSTPGSGTTVRVELPVDATGS